MTEKADRYKCPGCGFDWGGYDRSPPYANCPDCDSAMLRQLTVPEASLLDAGFVPVRFNA